MFDPLDEGHLEATYKGAYMRVVGKIVTALSTQYLLQSLFKTVYLVNHNDPDLVVSYKEPE